MSDTIQTHFQYDGPSILGPYRFDAMTPEDRELRRSAYEFMSYELAEASVPPIPHMTWPEYYSTFSAAEQEAIVAFPQPHWEPEAWDEQMSGPVLRTSYLSPTAWLYLPVDGISGNQFKLWLSEATDTAVEAEVNPDNPRIVTFSKGSYRHRVIKGLLSIYQEITLISTRDPGICNVKCRNAKNPECVCRCDSELHQDWKTVDWVSVGKNGTLMETHGVVTKEQVLRSVYAVETLPTVEGIAREFALGVTDGTGINSALVAIEGRNQYIEYTLSINSQHRDNFIGAIKEISE